MLMCNLKNYEFNNFKNVIAVDMPRFCRGRPRSKLFGKETDELTAFDRSMQFSW